VLRVDSISRLGSGPQMSATPPLDVQGVPIYHKAFINLLYSFKEEVRFLIFCWKCPGVY
jgi:hypothetical protein